MVELSHMVEQFLTFRGTCILMSIGPIPVCTPMSSTNKLAHSATQGQNYFHEQGNCKHKNLGFVEGVSRLTKIEKSLG